MLRLLIYLIISALSLTTWASDNDEYFNLMGKADTAIAEERWDDAENYLLTAMRSQPGNPSNVLLLSNLGIVQYNQGKTDAAIDTLTAAYDIAPTLIAVLNNRAKVFIAVGRDNDAYDDYGRILAIDSTLVEPLFVHGMMALHQGKLDIAKRDFTRLEQVAPTDISTDIAMGSYYSATMQWEKALSHYGDLIENEPDTEYYIARAACYIQLQRYDEASSDIAEGLALSPDDPELYVYRACLNKLRFRPDDAKADAQRAIELGADKTRVATLLK